MARGFRDSTANGCLVTLHLSGTVLEGIHPLLSSSFVVWLNIVISIHQNSHRPRRRRLRGKKQEEKAREPNEARESSRQPRGCQKAVRSTGIEWW